MTAQIQLYTDTDASHTAVYANVLRTLSSLEGEPTVIGPVFGLLAREQLGAEALMVISRDRSAPGGFRMRWCDLAPDGSLEAGVAQYIDIPAEGTELALLLSDVSPCVWEHWSIRRTDPLAELLCRFHSLLSLPAYDQGMLSSVVVLFRKAPDAFPQDQIPELMCLINLLNRTIQAHDRGQQLRQALSAIDRELRTIGDIERLMLPAEIPAFAGGRLAVGCQPTRHAGGDYYNFFPLPNGEIGILLADARGHGSPVVIPVTILHTLAHVHTAPTNSPAQFLAFLNTHVSGLHSAGIFATALYGIFSPTSRTFRYASAAHPVPRVLGCAGVRPAARPPGLPLGMRRNETFSVACETLRPGECLVLYTDGVTDADTRSAQGQPMEVEGLDQLLLAHLGDSPESLVDAILAYMGPVDHARRDVNVDDRTILALGVH